MTMNLWLRALMAAATAAPLANAISFSPDNPASIKSAAAVAANGLMELYVNNATNTTPILVGTFDQPVYWWEAGAVWGGMVDYWSYTGDASYVATTKQALLAQKGPANDFMNVEWAKQLGNDDEVFWALAAMSAAEQEFPASGVANASWLDLAVNTFNIQITRWDTQTCNGGLRWQIYSTNRGYTYKNSISNGGLFQLSARLARYTNNATYADWAAKVWDWSVAVGFIDADYNVIDGADVGNNCTDPDRTQWSYNVAMYLYGAAAMYNHTAGAVADWQNRTTGLLTAAKDFFGPHPNTSHVMYEPACEPYGTCNTDQISFKAYMARWLAKTTVIAPFAKAIAAPYLLASAKGAAQACSGGTNGTTCGYRWDIAGYDGTTGVGPQLAAMEVLQSLLIGQAPAPANSATAYMSSAVKELMPGIAAAAAKAAKAAAA